MKQRIISGAIIALLTIGIVLIGGPLLQVLAAFITFWGSYEFVKARKHKINWLEYGLMVLYILAVNFFFDRSVAWLLILVVLLFTIGVFDELVSIEDIGVTLVESVILAYGVYELREIASLSKWMLGYMFIIVYITDVFALFTGMMFGKHKLNERVSPKKTIEGAIGGWIFGGVISAIYAYILNWFYMNYKLIIICSIVLPICGQIGDLTFSLIKRYFGIKDYSKLIPGHGGLLDRLDSFLFVLLIFGAIFVFYR